MIPTPAQKTPKQQVGRYAIFDEIASGGMATVHLARFAGPLGFSRVVAAKRLHPHLLDDDEFKRMFLDEARLAARIRHPNVVPTLDVVVNAREIILVMEYVHGESLLALHRAARERGTPVPLPIAAAVLLSMLHGLDAAHEARSETGEPLHIVHRDVSPHNVLVGLDGAVRLLDFGVSKAIQARPDTRPGTLKGKFSYMAPEVLRGETITLHADIFSAAVVFWELVTGKKLFGGANEHERMLKILAGNYPAPSQVVDGLPPAVDLIVMKALHPDVVLRYQTAAEMALDIETHLATASQRVVGEWVRDLAAPTLERRAELLHQIEISRIHSVPPMRSEGGELQDDASEDAEVTKPAIPALPSDPVSFLASFGAPPRKAAPKPRRWIAAAVGGAMLLAASAALLLRARAHAHPAAVPEATPAAIAPLPAPPPAAEPPAAREPAPAAENPAPTSAAPDAKDNASKAQNSSRPTKPSASPPPRRASTRPSGNARTFLPDDL
jgi:serine/threonine-protein kinase